MYILFRLLSFLLLSIDGIRNVTKLDNLDSFNSMSKGLTFDSYNNLTDLEDYPIICEDYESEHCASAWLKETDYIMKRNSNRMANVAYQYSTNINDENSKLKIKFQKRYKELNNRWKNIILKFKFKHFKSPLLKRIFQLLSPNIQSNNETVTAMLVNISQEIEHIYNNGQPCFGTCLSPGEVGIIHLFSTERNYDTLSGFWSAWRNVTGRKIKNLYVKRMNLENIGAKENGFSDAASFELQNDFEENNFNETIVRLYDDIAPFYRQLHGFVRYCLSKFYPNKFNASGPIPAHILGNVWAQEWHNIMDIIKLCRGNVTVFNIQDEANKNLRLKPVKTLFKIAEEFYTSIGMPQMTRKFWNRSVIEQQPGKLIDCHGSAYDFSNIDDFRILMCTLPTLNDFGTIHHEMGHIEYFMAYRAQPYPFQGSANHGFHEAIGDTISLSVMTPGHLKRIGLISSVTTSQDFDIEYLLTTALEKVVFLPFALTMDSFVWSIYNGSVPSNKLNAHWWDLRYRYQGLMPPTQRTEDDFDAAGKYHIAFGISYIRYFMSFIQQFQFYESMCNLSDYEGPLHLCDFYQSKAAGKQLLKMLEKGRSQHWRDSLKILTGSRDITSRSLVKYFQPLMEWLIETNKQLNIPIGW